jgi:arylformamidase
MVVYDITRPLRETLAPWPGDTPYTFQLNWRMSEGAPVNVGEVRMGVHMGSHADAPFHFEPEGEGMGETALDAYLGAAQVIDVTGKEIISREDLAVYNLSETPRVLLRTNGWPNSQVFPDTIPVLHTDVPAWMHEQGVVLLGVDVPSVDPLDSKDLPNHHSLNRHHIRILESLILANVPEGTYELIALPMKLMGADGAPIRAILRTQGAL